MDLCSSLGLFLAQKICVSMVICITTFVGGFEYCFVGLFDSAYDVNWLMEYQYDDRENVMNVVTQNDVMLGSRLVSNDIDGTQILAGVIQELDYSNVSSGFIEASSRINDN